MEKNPDVSFAMEESFPFKSTYSSAAPLGPVMELRVQDPQDALTADRAAQSVDYWRTIADQLTADPQTPDGSDPRKAYAKMICAQAGLMLDRNYPAEAEQVYRIANEILPSSPEAVFRYVQLLIDQKRFADAVPVVQNAVNAAPDEKAFRDLLESVKTLK
jgi:predicted Zn-dependent protease